jgi:hypothetical protein
MRIADPRARFISEEFLAAMVILVALAVRIFHVIFTARMNPLAHDLTLDAAIYDRWAKALVWGGEMPSTQLMQAPLYPWFVSLVYRVFGPSLTAVRAAQAVLGAFTCGFVITATRRLLLSSTAGIIAGLIMALYLPAIFYEGVLLPATLILFLGSLFLVLMTHERGHAGPLRLMAAGFVLGLSVLARPTALLLVPFAIAHLVIAPRLAPDPPAPSLVRRIGALIVGLVFAVAPLTIRNARTTGGFVPVTTGGGINFYIGNNPAATGFYSVPTFEGRPLGGTPEEQRRMMYSLAAGKLGREPSAPEVSSFWLGEGLRWIRSDPGGWAALTWRKFLFFLNRYERANVESLAFHRRFGGILALPLFGWWFVAAFGLLGIFLSRALWKRLWLLYGGVLAALAMALAFYVLARYRLPVVVYLVPFAGGAVAALLKMLRDGKWLDLGIIAAALVLLLYLTGMPLAKDTTAVEANNLVRLGRVYLRSGDEARAREALQEALTVDPSDETARRMLERIE